MKRIQEKDLFQCAVEDSRIVVNQMFENKIDLSVSEMLLGNEFSRSLIWEYWTDQTDECLISCFSKVTFPF